MPSPFPRVNVVVTDEQFRVLERLSKLDGRSMSSFVRKTIELAMPTWVDLLNSLEKSNISLRSMDDNLEAAMQELLSEAEDELAEQLTIDDFLKGTGAGARGRRGAKPREAATNPPSTDRGVKGVTPSTVIPIRGKRS